MLVIGETLKQRYLIEARLGRGAMGEVFRATDLRYDEPVAVKMVVADEASDQYRTRFLREISALRKLRHPNIVAYVDAFATDERLFLVMEYVGGGTLADLIRDCGQAPADLFRRIARKLAEAVASAHALGVVHRDLKPSNILLTADSEPKIADFGLVKLANFSTITLSGGAMGTLGYMPPEAFEASAAQDHRGDIWALGVIFYQMLAGCLPFPDRARGELVRAILQDPPAPLSQFRPNLPPVWYAVIARCLEKSVGNRYQSALDLLDDLQSAPHPNGYSTVLMDQRQVRENLSSVYDLGPDPRVNSRPRRRPDSTPRLETGQTITPQRTETKIEVKRGSYLSRWAEAHVEKLARRRRSLLPPGMQMIVSFLVWSGVILSIGSSVLIVSEYSPATATLDLPFGSLRAVQTLGAVFFIAGMFFALFHVAARRKVELLSLIGLTVADWLFFFSGRVQLQVVGDLELSMLGTIFYAILIILYFRIQSD